MNTMAARLRGLREQAAFSQQKLSKTLNVAQASLCRYECGETEAPASVLLKYADFFDSLWIIFSAGQTIRTENHMTASRDTLTRSGSSLSKCALIQNRR